MLVPGDKATRDCRALLMLLAFGYAVCGLPAIPVGLFVGPYILSAGLGMLAMSGVAVALVWGLDRGSTAARWGTRILAFALLATAFSGVAAAWLEGSWGGAAFCGYFTVVGAVLLERSIRLPAQTLG